MNTRELNENSMAEIKQNQDNRRAFVDTLLELMEKDPAVVMVTCDVGFNYLERVKEKYPDRYFNFGVTEQSTTLIATALALSGFKVYLYSMINFVLFRNYEMVRNGIVHHKANVKLLGVKGSSSYKFLGFSHNMTHEREDADACEALQLDCYLPRDIEEVKKVIINTYENEKAAYIRL